jgi:hypothetical protein
LKYYQWRDLYDKKLDSPFKPKQGDNFDEKYCNGGDKIGPDTKDKYENILKDETFRNAFLGFTYHGDFVEEGDEELKKNNSNINKLCNSVSVNVNGINQIPTKFVNPHLNIQNVEYTIEDEINVNNCADNKFNPMYPNDNLCYDKSKITVDKSITANIENKFIKMKKQACSSSTSSLLRQYKNSNISQNSTNSSLNYLKRGGGGSTTNLNN